MNHEQKSKYFQNPKKYLEDKGITYTPKIIPMYSTTTIKSKSTFQEFYENLRARFK